MPDTLGKEFGKLRFPQKCHFRLSMAPGMFLMLDNLRNCEDIFSEWCCFCECSKGDKGPSFTSLPLGVLVSCRGGKIWKMALLCVMWAIWYECNSWTFEGVEHPSHVVRKSTLGCFYEWMIALSSIHSCLLIFLKICRLLKHEFNPLGVVLYAFLCIQIVTFVLMK